MFVSRLIKTLDHDVKVLDGKAPAGDGISNFLFPHKDISNPTIDIGGKRYAIAKVLYEAMTAEDANCQFFDFGFLDNEAVKEESIEVAKAYEVGLIDLPAGICWMEHEWIDVHGLPVRSGYLFIKSDDGINGMEVRRLSGYVVRTMGHILGEPQENLTVNMNNIKEVFVWDGKILHLPEGASHTGYEAGVIVNTMDSEIDPCNLFDPLMTMLGRLNADGIDHEYVPAPAKLNRRRERSGIPPVVSYTEVKIRPYRAPLGHSGPHEGDYTPKRYHFRRGHVRHFQNGEVTWVRPTFCGSQEYGTIRHNYKVES